MGRWLARLATKEKNTQTPGNAPDETDETSSMPVLSVLSGCRSGEYGKFLGDDPQPSDAEVAAAEWEERAAVLEYDEGLPRAEAERLAREQIYHRVKFGAAKPLPVSDLQVVDSPGLKPAVAGVCEPKQAPKTPAASPALQPPGWLSEPSPGVRILRPAIEVPAAEYDAHLDAMIAALPDGSAERNRLAFAKRKGWVVERDGERIFTRGRF